VTTRRGDDGVTLVDVMVSMAVMSVVVAVFTSGIVDMFRTANHADAAAAAQAQILTSFNRLEREIRYAQRIMEPHAVANGFAVEFVINDASGVLQCTQLVLMDGGAMTEQQWPAGESPTKPATTIATGLEPKEAEPFLQLAAGTLGSNFDRLQVRVTTTVGTGRTAQTRSFDLQYTALNTVSAKTVLPSCP
jgi:type II secretory pathway pseudopilin PulG